MPHRHRRRRPVANAPSDTVEQPLSHLSRVLLAVIVALLFFEHAAYGAVEAWSELTSLLLTTMLAALLLARLAFDRHARLPATVLWVPLVLFMLLVLWQATPLPWPLLETIAPTTAHQKATLLQAESLPATAISYYPPETWRMLRVMLIGVVLFATAVSLGGEQRGARTLLLIVFGVGVAQALFALAQMVAQEDWLFAAAGLEARRWVTAGTYLNYSNFCQCLNLAIGAGLALLFCRIEHDRHRGKRQTWESFSKSHGLIIAGLAICALAVLASLSRNGVLAMLLAGGSCLLLLRRRRAAGWQAWAFAAAPVAVVLGLLVVGVDAVYDRFSLMREGEVFGDRWQLALAVLTVWRDHPWWGVGLGAHEFVFPGYDTTGATRLAQTADNDYVQLLEEVGLIGFALVGVFVVLLGARALRLASRGRSSLAWASYGLLFGLLAVAVQSWTDFGQRVPGVFSLTSLLAGLVVALDARERRLIRSSNGVAAPRRLRWGVIGLALAMTPLGLLTLRSAALAYGAEQAWAEAYYLEKNLAAKEWHGSNAQYAALLTAAETASVYQPADVQYAYWLNVYRRQALLASASSDLTPEEREQYRAYLAQIADELDAVRGLCPTFGPACTLEGRLRYFELDQKTIGASLIEQGAELAPQHPDSQLVAGLLAIDQQDANEAMRRFTRLLNLDASYFAQVAEQIAVTLNAPEAAEELGGNDAQRLRQLAAIYRGHEELAERAERLDNYAAELLQARALQGSATSTELVMLAQAAGAEGDWERAVDLYRRALSHDYHKIDWRLQLAQALRSLGRNEEAMHQLRICLRLRPGHQQASRLLDSIYEQSRGANDAD